MASNIWTFKMPWQLGITFVYTTLLFSLLGSVGDCISLPGIHWNSSNPMFKTSNNDHIVEVNIYDDIDFVCPHFPQGTDPNLYEYYIIHQVSKKEYDDCTIYSDNTAVMIVNCSDPRQKKRFTILFEPFQSIPNVPEYKAGGTYFYISTSSGGKDGLMNMQRGACHYKNMKLTIRVCCETTTSSQTLAASNITTLAPAPSSQPSSTTTRQTTTLRPSSVSRSVSTRRPSSTATTQSSTRPSSRSTTTTTATTTRTSSKQWPSTKKGSSTDPSVKYTDKNSGKGGKEDKGDSENESYPKHEGLVNSSAQARHLTPPVLLGSAVTLLVLALVCR